jgi:predicted cupin superfamily sugar epimerase
MSTHDQPTAEKIIRLLGLVPLHTEGGFFRECYRSGVFLPPGALPARYAGGRSAGSAIYYLLTPDAFSAIHRLRTDEIFHFYFGDPVEMLLLYPDGTGETRVIGSGLVDGMRPQAVVSGGVWQGSRLLEGGRFALMGATMAPGFDPADFEAGDRASLIRAYPAFRESIKALSAGKPDGGRSG